MNNRRTLIAAIVGGALLLGAAGLGILYFVVFAGSSPQKLALSSPTPSSSASSGTSSTPGAGTWTIDSGSQAGYRVREKLASFSAPSDAVGRTTAVTGTLTLSQATSGFSVTAANFTVDVSRLTSDQSRRDQRIHSQGLESDRFPTATFKLTSPIALTADAGSGQTVRISATGDLTMHGVTKSVTIPIDARLTGSKIELVGSITFPFSQFGMTPPSIGGFVSVENNATMEFQLLLTRQSA
jgi:polyisoprenoid-binding protein YceI